MTKDQDTKRQPSARFWHLMAVLSIASIPALLAGCFSDQQGQDNFVFGERGFKLQGKTYGKNFHSRD
jgi:hypothetical protein